ncbi:MAG: hypothetical protein KA019_01040, partial [Burkholderiales bacterium]|nr:hypothetical protein [Burkholderiales bacterium]
MPGRSPADRPAAIARRAAGIGALLTALALGGAAGAAGPKLLPAEQAFRLSARALDATTLE